MKSRHRTSLCWAVYLLGILLVTYMVAESDDHSISGKKAHSRYADNSYVSDHLSKKKKKKRFSRLRFKTAPKISITEKQPKKISLLGNHPNPFNPNTTIEFELYRHGLVRLEIFNFVGQRVATLLNGPLDAGTYHRTWNGKDENGNILPSGTYVVYLQAGTQKESRSMTLLK